jgi:TetR/AcrR family transcriptional regulator, transcriptional repressor for nem operon
MGTSGAQPRKRVRTAQGQRTYDRIVEAAAELMHRDGVRATSVEDVLDRCGAGKSQMYHYFTSKQDLLIAVIDWQWDLTRDTLGMTTKEIDCWLDIQLWLQRVLDVQEANQTPHRCPLGSLACELAGVNQAARTRLDAIFSEWTEYLASGLTRMKASGLLRASADPHALAVVTLATVQGGTLLAHTHAQLSPLRAALTAAYEYLRSYAANEP